MPQGIDTNGPGFFAPTVMYGTDRAAAFMPQNSQIMSKYFRKEKERVQ